MGRILSKEEFMESMITSAEEAEESKNMDPEVPEEKPRKKLCTTATDSLFCFIYFAGHFQELFCTQFR